jgi:hypothetical protein
LVDAIKENNSNNNTSDLAEVKMNFLTSEVQRKKKTLELRVEESQLRKEESRLTEFFSLRDNIKNLRMELISNTITNEEKEELMKDIDGLLLRKQQCAKFLGME